jgi:hypothetical protein
MERVDVVCCNQPASAGVVVVGNSEVVIRGPIHLSVRIVCRRSSFELFERCFINHNNHNNDGSKPPRPPSLLSWLAVPHHARESRRLIGGSTKRDDRYTTENVFFLYRQVPTSHHDLAVHPPSPSFVVIRTYRVTLYRG